MPASDRHAPASVRFWKFVNTNGSHLACWEWTGSKIANGYGTISVNGKAAQAHRFSWELHNGAIPVGHSYHGVCVRHKCDNRACVNPDHMELGSHADNMRDRDSRGRGVMPKCPIELHPRGEAHGRAKVTEDDVRAIRQAKADGATLMALAEKYGLSKKAVLLICQRKNWRHVQ